MTDRLERSSLGWLVVMCILSPSMAWAGPDAIPSKDQQFLMRAAETQQEEIALGQMATQRAESDKVKQLAQRMVDDHTKAGQEMRKLAETTGFTLSDEPSVGHQKRDRTYSNLSSKEFDRAYVAHEVKHHRKNIAEFKKQAERLKSPQIRQWAAGTLPVLKEHLLIANSVLASLKNGSKQSNPPH